MIRPCWLLAESESELFVSWLDRGCMHENLFTTFKTSACSAITCDFVGPDLVLCIDLFLRRGCEVSHSFCVWVSAVGSIRPFACIQVHASSDVGNMWDLSPSTTRSLPGYIKENE
ncbi:hypothetical protein NDU88_002747 [Pleurodeles waltl]|uniref:Uncharacterized protein n=1 Tax=Pleurodeles waltl TaxID=8319 RepID=A0AAV7W3P3_PLEWA|nr:hypothetical protein NDU88_002747 [Pleurodeles waltl]